MFGLSFYCFVSIASCCFVHVSRVVFGGIYPSWSLLRDTTNSVPDPTNHSLWEGFRGFHYFVLVLGKRDAHIRVVIHESEAGKTESERVFVVSPVLQVIVLNVALDGRATILVPMGATSLAGRWNTPGRELG